MKRAEKREPKSKTTMENIPGMSAYHHLGAQPGYGAGQFGHQGPYGMQPPMGMGRGYGGYGAAGFGGGPPGPAPGFGYGGVPAAPFGGDPGAGAPAMYGRGGGAPGYSGGFPAGVPGAQQQTMSAGGSAGGAPGGYPEYNRMQGPQAGPPGPPNIEGAGPSDYSSFGLGNYPQQELQYGPQRGTFPSESNFGSYGGNDPPGYNAAGPGYVGEGPSFGRGASAPRGFHPYGR